MHEWRRRALSSRLLAVSALLWVATGTEALAARDDQAVQVPLSNQLLDLARRSGAELIYDEALVRGLRVKPVSRRLATEAALRALLADTDISYRTTADGSFILYRREAVAEPAIPEILVIGRRSQNADIARTENDVQSYQVVSGGEIRRANRDNLDLYLRSRLTTNADMLAPMQNVIAEPGSTQSRVNLRGVGARRTLLLLDGRRMPSLPTSSNDFDQPDLNGIPLGAIERVEVLTSTSGGIYGSGAIGGVINVVLRHDYRGADLTATSGITTRGDAATLRIEGRLGISSDDGASGLMVYGSIAKAEPLRYGQRAFISRAQQVSAVNDPQGTIFPLAVRTILMPTNGIIVASATGVPLSFDAEAGGPVLPASFTYLPLDFQGSQAEKIAELVRNAGKVPPGLAPGYAARDRSLLSTPDIRSLLFTARHRFDNDIELFVDGIYFQNRGQGRSSSELRGVVTPASASINPFGQDVIFGYPVIAGGSDDTKLEVSRVVGGVVVPLPGGWKANAEYAIGRATSGYDLDFPTLTSPQYVNAIRTGMPGSGGLPALDPLGNWQTFQSALSAYYTSDILIYPQRNVFHDASLRVAGPVTRLPGGPLSLTLLAEQRNEEIKSQKFYYTQNLSGEWTPHRGLQVQSLYGEVRAPVMPSNNGSLLSGLELQFAARYDRTRAALPENTTAREDQPLASVKRQALMFTTGARVFPLPGIMLRASYATGTMMPEFNRLVGRQMAVVRGSAPDPLRGGRILASEGSYVLSSGGSRDLDQEKASTFSVGLVFNADGRRAPRISVDYSRIFIRRQIEDFLFTADEVVANEAFFPGRVTRAPLTDQDRALGFSAGRVLGVDTRVANTGRSIINSIELQFDWPIDGVLGGELSPYAQVTWIPSMKSTSPPGLSDLSAGILPKRTLTNVGSSLVERTGFFDGPLALRGNGGLLWQRGSVTIDFNMQYYSGYSLAQSDPLLGPTTQQRISFNGRSRIPAQVYFDLAANWEGSLSGAGPFKNAAVRLGIVNILDKAPPIAIDPQGLTYSTYGDPRGRRVELSTSFRF